MIPLKWQEGMHEFQKHVFPSSWPTWHVSLSCIFTWLFPATTHADTSPEAASLLSLVNICSTQQACSHMAEQRTRSLPLGYLTCVWVADTSMETTYLGLHACIHSHEHTVLIYKSYKSGEIILFYGSRAHVGRCSHLWEDQGTSFLSAEWPVDTDGRKGKRMFVNISTFSL